MPFTLPGHTLIQARFERAGGGAPNRVGDPVVNTFYFRNGAAADPEAACVARLETFYFALADAAGQTNTIGSWLSPVLTGLTYYARQADQLEGTPGREYSSSSFLTGAVEALPDELAVCASYRAEPPHTASRRGRIYLGPFHHMANNEGRVIADLKDDIEDACRGLASDSPSNPVQWVIASRKHNSASDVREGYVDDHFDVQRRRDIYTEQYGRTPSTWGAEGYIIG